MTGREAQRETHRETRSLERDMHTPGIPMFFIKGKRYSPKKNLPGIQTRIRNLPARNPIRSPRPGTPDRAFAIGRPRKPKGKTRFSKHFPGCSGRGIPGRALRPESPACVLPHVAKRWLGFPTRDYLWVERRDMGITGISCL